MPRHGSHCLRVFSPAPLLLADFPSLRLSHGLVAAPPLENCLWMHHTRTQKPEWGISASSGLAPAKEPPRVTIGAVACAMVQLDSAVQCPVAQPEPGSALTGPKFYVVTFGQVSKEQASYVKTLMPPFLKSYMTSGKTLHLKSQTHLLTQQPRLTPPTSFSRAGPLVLQNRLRRERYRRNKTSSPR